MVERILRKLAELSVRRWRLHGAEKNKKYKGDSDKVLVKNLAAFHVQAFSEWNTASREKEAERER